LLSHAHPCQCRPLDRRTPTDRAALFRFFFGVAFSGLSACDSPKHPCPYCGILARLPVDRVEREGAIKETRAAAVGPYQAIVVSGSNIIERLPRPPLALSDVDLRPQAEAQAQQRTRRTKDRSRTSNPPLHDARTDASHRRTANATRSRSRSNPADRPTRPTAVAPAMAGLFRTLYDWMLRTFWYVFGHMAGQPPLNMGRWGCCAALRSPRFLGPGPLPTRRDCGVWGSLICTSRPGRTGLRLIADPNQGDGARRDLDRVAKCWQNVASEGSRGEHAYNTAHTNMCTNDARFINPC